MINIKLHQSYRKIVALCDSELLGKKFEEGNKQLDLRENFYKGEELNEERIIALLKDYQKDDATFNIVGENAVKTALKSGIIDKNGVGKIAGIPYALVLR